MYKIGDVLLKHVSDLFEHFIEYGSHQIISKYKLETERSANSAFAEFVQVKKKREIVNQTDQHVLMS